MRSQTFYPEQEVSELKRISKISDKKERREALNAFCTKFPKRTYDAAYVKMLGLMGRTAVSKKNKPANLVDNTKTKRSYTKKPLSQRIAPVNQSQIVVNVSSVSFKGNQLIFTIN